MGKGDTEFILFHEFRSKARGMGLAVIVGSLTGRWNRPINSKAEPSPKASLHIDSAQLPAGNTP